MALWTPTNLGSKLKLWLKGDQLTGITGAAATWTDQSGNSVALTNGTGTPTQVAAGLNGLNTVAFAGASNQYFALPSNYLTGRTASATFAIVKTNNDPPSVETNTGPIFGDWGSDPQSNHYPYLDGNIYDDYCSTARKTVGNPAPSLTSWRLLGFRSQANDWRVDLDATNLFTTATNTVGTSTNPKIGHTSNTNSGFPEINFDGQSAEIVDCNDFLTTAEKEKIEGYLMWKFGLQSQLPSGHTYKSAAPTTGRNHRSVQWI